MSSAKVESPTTESGGGKRKRDSLLGRRQEIVTLAMDLFAQKGVQATSVREIASQAGILSGSLYSHFESKSEILDLGLRPYTEVYLEKMREVLAQKSTAEKKVHDLLEQSFTLMIEWRSATVVTNSDWEYISTLDGFEFLRAFYAEVQSIYLTALNQAITEKSLAADISPEMVQRLLSDIILGVARRYHPGTRFGIDITTDYVHRMLFSGLGAPKPEAPSA